MPTWLKNLLLVGKIYFFVKIGVLALSAILVVVQVLAGFNLELSIATAVQGPATYVMAQMYDAVTNMLPWSLADAISYMSVAVGTVPYFHPAFTFEGFCNVLGVQEAWNALIMTFLYCLNLILSIRFFRWALSKFGIRF